MAVPKKNRSLFKAYTVGFSILLLSASFYYVKNGYVEQVIRIGNDVREIERLRDLAIQDSSCSKPGVEKGLCAARQFEKWTANKTWTETGTLLIDSSKIAFISRMKKTPPLSCGLYLKEIELFLALNHSQHPKVRKNALRIAKQLKQKMGRQIASSKFKEPECTKVAKVLKEH